MQCNAATPWILHFTGMRTTDQDRRKTLLTRMSLVQPFGACADRRERADSRRVPQSGGNVDSHSTFWRLVASANNLVTQRSKVTTPLIQTVEDCSRHVRLFEA